MKVVFFLLVRWYLELVQVLVQVWHALLETLALAGLVEN